jgi:Sortase domain
MRWTGLLRAGAVALALLVGCAGSDTQHAQRFLAAGFVTAGQPAAGAAAARGFHSQRGYRATPVPVRLAIPKLHVSATLDQIGRARDGTVQTPSRWDVPGWYAPGARPGEPGSAVILGHVDSTRGPAVFYRLRELRPGDEIDVTRADGSSLRFVVQRTAQYPKDAFPTDEVYYPTLTPALRLVTCGGRFDFSAGHYRSNVIVFATIAAGR